MKKRKWLWKVIAGIIGTAVLLSVANFVPTWNLETKDMHKMEGSWITVYYEEEEEAAEDVFQLADSEAGKIAATLGFSEKQDVNVYIYDNQNTMQTKKYGFLARILSLDWYIGDNIGTDVILTSPANPGKVHDYDNNKYAVLHEIVHAYVSVMNPGIDLWLTEGMALYLSNGEPFYKEYLEDMAIPSYEEVCTRNPIRFSDSGGYTFAHTYIEYLARTYGWEKVLELIRTEDYREVFGKSGKEIYEEWVDFLYNYYQ